MRDNLRFGFTGHGESAQEGHNMAPGGGLALLGPAMSVTLCRYGGVNLAVLGGA